jgi:signal transduction histidine kinase
LISGVIGLSPFYIDWDHVKALLTLSHVGFYVCMSYEAWRVGLLLNIRSAYWISVLYVPVIALMLASVANSLMASMHVDFFNAGLINWGMVLMGALSSLGLHIGYVGIVMELRRRTEMRVLDEVLRGQIRTEHSQQIAHLQRQQLMGEVSSFMSHEVRQPLTAILSNAQLARHMLGQAQRAPADLDRIMGAIVQGVRRVDELMQRVARHVRAPVRHESEFSLADLVRDSVEMMQGIAHKRSVTLSVQGPSRHDVVKGDFIELSQILLNLIRNAIDACAQAQGGGQVILRLQHAQRRVVVSVEDNGPGFDAQALLQAGQSFYTTKPDGLGLGLSISRELATQNGAELSWRNGPDGALVQLSFPVRSMDDPVDDVGYTSKIPSE